jgi:hypothetical protein
MRIFGELVIKKKGNRICKYNSIIVKYSLFLIIENCSIQMNYYFTPSKSSSKRSSSTQVQEKPSDWICVVCNNLNFSFRKKCNRCKTQTRIQNETQLATAYSEYYFQNYLTSAKSPLTDITNSNTPEPSHQKYCEDGIPTSNFNETIISTIGKVLPF